MPFLVAHQDAKRLLLQARKTICFPSCMSRATSWIGLGQAIPIGRLILGLLRLELTVSLI